MVAAARRRGRRHGVSGRVKFTVADLADLPLPDACAELVVSTVSLHHWTGPGAVIASLSRVLRPDGRIWIYDFRFTASAAAAVRAAATGLLSAPHTRTCILMLWPVCP